LNRPLSVLVQSSSAAGKTSLVAATLALMLPECQLRVSSLT
jgi:Ni2+-binding GTPase involved in maturation of urease and hydrogenase